MNENFHHMPFWNKNKKEYPGFPIVMSIVNDVTTIKAINLYVIIQYHYIAENIPNEKVKKLKILLRKRNSAQSTHMFDFNKMILIN